MLRLLKVSYFVLCLIGIVPGSFLGSELAEPASVKILVLGRTGSGKSTLINNILGRKIASVGHRLHSETRIVSAYQKEIYGVSVTVCDTPGLGDASGNEEDYMKKIKASCGDPDLVIYCLSMDNTRWHTDDVNAIKIVTKSLGKEVWEYSMLGLTFADKFVANLPENKVDELFKQRRLDSEQLFKETLEELGVQLKADKLFSAVSAKGRKHLPGVRNWMTYLMITCLTMTRDDGIEGFHQIVLGRLTNPHPEDKERLIWTNTLCSFMQMNPASWAGSILGFKAGGYFAGKLFAARIGSALAGPVGGFLGGVTGYTLEYVISFATCSGLDNDRDEL